MKKKLKIVISIICLFGAIYLFYDYNHMWMVLFIIPVFILLNEVIKIVKRKRNRRLFSKKYSYLYNENQHRLYTRQSNNHKNEENKDDELLNMYMYDVSF